MNVSHNIHSCLELSSSKHKCGTYLHEHVEVPEHSESQLRRVKRSAHSTKAAKSTAVKAAMPRTVGLPKPLLNPGKVR